MILDRRLVVMVTDQNGSRYINVSMIFRQLSLYFLLFILGIVLFLGISISAFNSEIKDINDKSVLIGQQYQQMIKRNSYLNEQINQRLEEIALAGDRINDLEGVIGVSKKDNELEKNDNLLTRIDVASITGAQKAFVMKFIPNGRPLDYYHRISAEFGNRMHPILHILHKHTGLDFSTQINTPVYSTADGVVDFAANGWNGGYGKLIKIAHSFGFKTYYAHLNNIVVKNGEFVKKGQVIGYSGNSGVSTGPHLHYEVRFLNQPIDPINFVKWDMKNFDSIFEKERKIAWQSLLTTINNLMGQEKWDPQPLSLKAQN
ncbi:M23 family metallopeptidase [Helicobacter sp. 11S02596-1]|uniref:M23 family metallopeptidase n=1 Tax=Helicobacter sp. 11S02596-1 TaxID=1476194 RepID=UPI000BA7DF75|nr:M23 family metallopeptidase [Helicobacter sp. 11S02596-1]PAF43554.1 peptidase M23 [Helicobacter sp. 11S02596-1]